MKKKVFFVAVAMTAAAVFSCQKNNEVLPVSDQPEVRTFTCTIADDDPETKMAIDNTGKSTWTIGDKILIHGKYTYEDVVVELDGTNNTISTDGKTASFTVALPATSYDPNGYYAAYPADAYVDYDNEHGYYYNSFDETNNILMAGYLSGDTFLFYNLCGVISFAVTGDFDYYEFFGNNGETVGYEKYHVKITSSDKNYKRTESKEENIWKGTHGDLTKITGAPVHGDGTTLNYICLPNGASFTNGFTIRFVKDGNYVKKVSTKAKAEHGATNVARGKILPLGDITSHLKDDSGYVHTPAAWTNGTGIDGVVDKSATADHANCYVISASDANKAYKIAAVEGNSSTSIGAIASVSVLWETNNTTSAVSSGAIVEAVDFSSDSQYVYFKLPSTLTYGNALIAAKDFEGNILWSWHIWVPNPIVADGSKAVKDTAATDFCGASAIQVLNLGALVRTSEAGNVDPKSIGLYYQWGRKDPFPSHGTFSSKTPIALTGEQMSYHVGKITTDYGVHHPLEYAHIKNFDGQDWNTTRDGTLWSNSGKTIYDPCPAGYRVPLRVSSKPMFTQSNEGWTLTTNRFVYQTYAFPISGYIDCYSPSYSNVGVRGLVWAATEYGSDYGYSLYDKGGTINPDSGMFSKAKASPVRCVAE